MTMSLLAAATRSGSAPRPRSSRMSRRPISLFRRSSWWQPIGRRTMADHWRQGSFAFRCTASECALIEELINAGYALANGDEPDPPSAALLSAFPSDDANAPWNAVREAFAGPEFPAIGADFRSEERRVGDACVSKCRSRGARYH